MKWMKWTEFNCCHGCLITRADTRCFFEVTLRSNDKVPPGGRNDLQGALDNAVVGWIAYWKAFSLSPLPPMARSFM